MLRFDPDGWGKAFQEESNNLHYFLSSFKVAIVHHGATALKDGRSNRNVDILITVESLADLSAVMVRLQSKGYKLIDYENNPDYHLMVAPKKACGYGVTIRIMVYASKTYSRYNAFVALLKEHEQLLRQYNDFRDSITKKCGNNWKEYRTLKTDYINAMIDEYFKFE